MPQYSRDVREEPLTPAGRADGRTPPFRAAEHHEHATYHPAQPSAASAPHRGRVGTDEIIFFANELAVMVDTGVPLTEALDAIAEQSQRPGLRGVLTDVSEQVKGGSTFSAALERHPRVFSNLFVALVRASEASGTMGAMLTRVAMYLGQQRETRKRVRGALVYPACMLGFCVAVVVGLLAFVLPRFEKIYANKQATLPTLTRGLMGLSTAIVDYWALLLLGLVSAVAAGYMFVRSQRGREIMDRLAISVPVIGSICRKASLARSLRTLAAMVSAGVSMLDALEITARVAGNRFYARVWMDVSGRITEGCTLAEPLGASPLIPGTVAQMISAGERTGKLALVMDRIAGFCEDDLKVAVRTVTQMIEPALIIVMGGIVGTIAIALLLPIFSISKVVAH